MEALLKMVFNTILILSYTYRISAVLKAETNIIFSNAAILVILEIMYVENFKTDFLLVHVISYLFEVTLTYNFKYQRQLVDTDTEFYSLILKNFMVEEGFVFIIIFKYKLLYFLLYVCKLYIILCVRVPYICQFK